MRIHVGIIAYNEEDFIEASIRSVYDHVDNIIVIDGSPWGKSKDNTVAVARSIGPKVDVITGTWKNKGTDHKMFQRQAYLSRMPKNPKDWCILQDADEAFDEENLLRLIDHMRKADEKTMLLSYQWRHIFGDCWHYISGGSWDKPRRVGAFRLKPGVCQFNHHIVGIHKYGKDKKRKDPRLTGPFGEWTKLGPPGNIILKDVMFFHYGQAQNREKQKARSKYYFYRDKKFRQGNETWDEYYERKFCVDWEVRMQQPNVNVYDGHHPKSIEPMIGTYWKR